MGDGGERRGGGELSCGWNKGRRFQRHCWSISIPSTATETGHHALYQKEKEKKTLSALVCNYSVARLAGCGSGNEPINVQQFMSTMNPAGEDPPPRGLCSHTDGTLRESVCWLFILARSPEGKCSQTHKSHKATRNRCFLKSSFPTMTWHQAAGEHDSDTPSLDTGMSNEGAGQTMRHKTGRKSGSKTGSVDLTTWNMSMTGTLTDFSKYDSMIEPGSAWWDHSLKQDVLYEFLNKIYINKILTWQKKLERNEESLTDKTFKKTKLNAEHEIKDETDRMKQKQETRHLWGVRSSAEVLQMQDVCERIVWLVCMFTALPFPSHCSATINTNCTGSHTWTTRSSGGAGCVSLCVSLYCSNSTLRSVLIHCAQRGTQMAEMLLKVLYLVFIGNPWFTEINTL